MSGNEYPGKLSDAASRPFRVDEARKLWVRSVAPMLVKPTGIFTLRWRDPATGIVDYEVLVAFAADGDKAGLRLSCDSARLIRMQATRQPRGGRRWRFLDENGRLCTVLLCPQGADRFRSREAWGTVSYASQRQSPRRRAEVKAKAIRLKLNGSPELDAPFPDRPAGMRRATYERHRAQAENAATIATTGRRLPTITNRETTR